jgi:hypothetical protein
MKEEDAAKSSYYSLFRVLGELRSSCIQLTEDIQSLQKTVATISAHINALQSVAMLKYNQEFKDETKD